MKKKLLALAVSICMMVGSCIPAFAADTVTTNEIKNADDLAAAIAAQENNQVWNLAAGNYDLTETRMATYQEIEINGEKNWVFPIKANNITIKGNGDVTITSSFEPSAQLGGLWHYQNFLTVAGENVSIENVDIKANYNAYNQGVNKAIEILAPDFSLKDSTIVPLENDGKKNSGSIFFNTEDLGDAKMENVTLSSWLTADYYNRWGANKGEQTGTLTVKNSTIDFGSHEWAGDADTKYIYGHEFVKADNLVMKVDNVTDWDNQVLNCLPEGAVIELTEDIKLKKNLYIDAVKDVTINGNNHTITAADDFVTGTGIKETANLVTINNSAVTLKDITLKTTAKNKHALNAVGSDVVLDGAVTLDNTNTLGGAAAIVNRSNVTVKGDLSLKTGEKSWYAVNLDNGTTDSTKTAELAFEKGSHVTFDSAREGTLLIAIEEDVKDEVKVTNPENAGIVKNEDGTYREEVKATKVELDANAKTLKAGESFTLKATVTPDNADNKTVVWASDNTAVATVDANGKVTAVAEGTATITAKVGDVTANCTVTVEKAATTETPSTPNEDNNDTGVNSYLMLFALLAVISAGAVVVTKKVTNK